MNVIGKWRRLPAIRVPSGTDAQALRKHTSTRLLVGASRKLNKEKRIGEVRGVGEGDDNDEDAIANDSGMIESHQVARTDDGRGGGGGNGDDGRFMQRMEDRSSVRGSLEELSSPSSSSPGAGMDIRKTGDNYDNVDLSISLPVNGPFHDEAGEKFGKGKNCSGEDIPTFANSSFENDNTGPNKMMKRKSSTASEREVPNKAAQIGLGLSAATFSSSTSSVREAKEQRPNPLKRKAKEKDLFFIALEKYGKRSQSLHSYEIPKVLLNTRDVFSHTGHDLTTVSEAVGTRTPTQVQNYFYNKKKTIARQKESKENTPNASVKAVKAAALPADHTGTMKGMKKKKTKKGKKEAACETPSKVDTPKKLTSSTDVIDSSRLGAASTENTRDSYSETELSRHQFRLHQQQQQLHLQLQQQQLERLVQQQQELIYRQQMQQDELYRQHIRQQEMLQAAQQALQLQQQHQHVHHQCQPYTEQRRNWNQWDRKCCSWMNTSFPISPR